MVKKKNSMIYLLSAVIMILAGILVSIIFATMMSSAAFDGGEPGTEASGIIQRTASRIGEYDTADAVNKRVGSGMYSVGDYVVRSLTSASYLSENLDDERFAEDLAQVLYGSSNELKQSEMRDDLKAHTRMYVINKYISQIDPDLEATSYISEDPGDSFSDLKITKSLQGIDGYTIGIRRVEGSFRVTGENVRSDFFVDGKLYQGSIKTGEPADDSGSRSIVMAWDTAGVESGGHDVIILLRSSDGRGRVVDGGQINVPHCMKLVNDNVQMGSITEAGSDSWYMIDCQERNCYVNFVGMSDDIKVTLYDVYGDIIGTNDIPDSEYEILRGQKQDVASITEQTGITNATNSFYVRVERGQECSTDFGRISYTMVQSRYVAKNGDEYLAVIDDPGAVPTPLPITGEMDKDDSPIMVNDINNNRYQVNRCSLNFLPIEGYFDSIEFNGQNVYPIFDRRNLYYALYDDAIKGGMKIDAVCQDGYSGEVSVTLENKDGVKDLKIGEEFEFPKGESVIRMSIKSFGGAVNTYTVYILNGKDEGGFYDSTLSKFPESYGSGLWLTHCVHPNYEFRPYYASMSFDELLDNEDDDDSSLANIYSDPLWVEPLSPVYDAGGWMTAKRDVVQYFLDPRNFMDPYHMFQFEYLSFDENVHTVEGIKAMIKGSFMDTDDYDYATALYNAGKTANVSPYFLASKIIQEMGYNGESELCHGTLDGYEGYYNFYNIGAVPNPEVYNGARINAARYAMWGRDPDSEEITAEERKLLLPWDNRDDALTGGALWIASGYTEVGQNTLYTQKFDIIDNDDGLYEHQYAQNVSMAYEEAVRYFKSYSSINMLDNSFLFVIPVYSDMPEDYGKMPETGN